MSHILSLCVFVPFIGALISLFVKNEKIVLKNTIVILTCFTGFVLTAYNLFLGDTQGETLLYFNFSSEGFQAVYAVITAFMWFCASIISPQYFKRHGKTYGYYFFFLLVYIVPLNVNLL